jgi:hypothetical protein
VPPGCLGGRRRRPADACAFVETLGTTDTWFGVNPGAGPPREHAGRGKAADVTRLTALFADLDVKGGGCPDLETAYKIVNDLSIILNTSPSAIALSGNGLHPYWPVSDHQTGKYNIALLLRRWGRLVTSVAHRHGAGVDNVYDLPRILRVPGSFNCKGLEPIPVVCYAEPVRRIPLSEVDEILAAEGIYAEPEVSRSRQPRQPLEPLSNPDHWKFAQKTCSYVGEIIRSLSTDVPKNGRHQWMMSKQVRLCCAWLLGCITEADLLRAQDLIYQRLCDLRELTGETVAGHEVSAALEYATNVVACKTEDDARAELGDHTHTSVDASSCEVGDDFWEKTDVLGHIRDFARARLVSPWAMLGVVLARVVARIPPTVQLPPLVGGGQCLAEPVLRLGGPIRGL